MIIPLVKFGDPKSFSLIMGQSPASKTYNKEGVWLPFFQWKKEFWEISPIVEQRCSDPIRIAEPWDILLSVRAPVWPTNIADQKCCIWRGLWAIRISKDKWINKYIWYFFKKFQTEISQMWKWSTFDAITKSDLENLEIPLPPLPIQKATVAKLDEASASIQSAQSQIRDQLSVLEKLWESSLHQIFENKNYPNIMLENLCIIERWWSPRPIDKFLTDSKDGINWIKIGDTKHQIKYINYTAEKIKPEWAKRSRMVYPWDFILSNSMSFGKPYIMNTSGCIHDWWLVLRPQDKINKEFLYYLLWSPFMYAKFIQTASWTWVKNLNINKVKKIEIPIPDLKTQTAIVSYLDQLTQEIRALKTLYQTQLQYYDKLRFSILDQTFKGELVK